jgi:hypothetical protein
LHPIVIKYFDAAEAGKTAVSQKVLGGERKRREAAP